MRTTIERGRDPCADEAGSHHATSRNGTPSSDPARYALAAVRAAVADRARSPVEAAVRGLAARATDPGHAETADETELDQESPEAAPLNVPEPDATPRERAPAPGAGLPDDDARIDTKRDEDGPAGRVASARDRIAHVRAALAEGRGLRPPETWLLATAISDLLGVAVDVDAEGRPRGDVDRPNLPALDRDAARRRHEGPDEIGGARHRAADERAAASREARRDQARDREADRRNAEAEKALTKGPSKGTPKKQSKAGKPQPAAAAKPAPPAPKPGKDGTVTVTPRTGGEAGGGAAVAAWKGRLDAKIGTVAAAPVPDGDRYVVTYQAASKHKEKQTDQRKRELLAAAKTAVTPINEYDKKKEAELQLPDDPTPKARRAVDAWVDKRIRRQDLPALQKSPAGSLPQLGTSTYTDREGSKHVVREISPGRYGEIHVLAPGEKPPALGAYDEVRKEKKLEGKGTLAERLKAHNDQEPRNLKPPAAKAIGAKANDDLPLQAPLVPSLEGYTKIDAGKVLEAALAGVDKHTSSILSRTVEAFPGGEGLPSGYTEDWRPEVKADVLAELEKIRDAAQHSNTTLKDKLAGEREKVDKEVKEAHDRVKEAKLDAKAGYRTVYEAVGDEIRGLRDDLDRRAEEEAEVAKGGFEVKEVKEKKARFLKANTDKVETWLGRYEGMRKRRREQLDKSEIEQTTAYQACAELDRRQIKAQAGPDKDKDPVKTEVADAIKAIDEWETDVVQGVDGIAKKFEKLRDEADTDVDTFTENLKTEGENYEKAVEEWARVRLGMERSFWSKLLDLVLGWLGLVKEEAKVWQERSEADNTVQLAEGEIFLREFQINHHEELTAADIKAMTGLSEDQRAILQSFFVDNKGDGAAALAAGLMAKLGVQWRPRLHSRLEQKVLKDHFSVVIAVANKSGISVDGKVAELHAGFTGPGTKKDKVYAALQGLSTIQARAVEFQYELTYGTPLRAEIEEELHDLGDILFYGSHDADRARALLAGSKSHADLKDPTKLAKGEAAAIAVQLDQTMHGTFGYGLGTDAKELLKLLRGRSLREMEAIKREYFARYGKPLTEEIKGELLDGISAPWQWQEALALLEGRPEDAEAAALRSSMGHVSTTGPRSYVISSALGGLLPLGGLGAAVDDDAIINRVTRDQKGAEEAFQRIQAEAAKDAQRYGWNDETYKRQLGIRLKKVDDTFGTKYGGEFGVFDPKQSALDVAFGKAFSADQAKLLTGIRTQNLALESAARVSIEHKAFMPDKKEVDRALADQYLRQYAADRRDVEGEWRKQKDDDLAAATVLVRDAHGNVVKDKYGQPKVDRAATDGKMREWRKRWVSAEGAYERRKEADAEAERRASAKAPGNMAALKKTYEAEGMAQGSMFSTGTFEGDVYSATNVSWGGIKDLLGVEDRTVDTDKTQALLAGGGYLTGGQQLFFAVYGPGTDEETVNQLYRTKSPAEIAKMHAELGTRMAKAGVSKDWTPEAWVKDDFSGRELDDVTVEMEFGETVTPDQKLKRAERQRELEKASQKGGIGDAIVGAIFGGPVGALIASEALPALREHLAATEMDVLNAQIASLRSEVAALEQDKADLAARGIVEGDAEYYEVVNKRYEQIEILAGSVDSALAAHRAQVDAIADWAAIGIQVIVGIASLIVGIVLTPVTGGASIAIAIAVISTLVTAGLTMAAKAAIKGGAYGWEEAAADATLAVVEAVAAGLTAGFGGPMLKGLGLAKNELDGAIAALVRKSIGHFVTGAIQAAPGAFVGALLHDGDFMDALSQILQGGLMAVALGTLTDPITEHFQAQKAISARTSPAEFEKAFKAFQQEHPGQARRALRAQLDEMILEARPGAFKEPAMQNAMRTELLEGLPPAQRKAMEHARFEVVSEKEFGRVTGRSASEPAAVTMKDGVPVVVVKAGTDLTALGREMPGLFRAVEPPAPRTARTVAEETPRPRGASASPDPLAPRPKEILEPFTGPNLESAIDLAAKNPGARVTATEASIKPDAAEIARIESAGGTYVPDNKPGHIAVGTVDEIKMRFPIPHERALQQDFVRRLGELETLHPNVPRQQLLDQAMQNTIHQAESLSAYGPYALERLKAGGSLEVVFHEHQILTELGDVARLRFVDPATGKAYRLEVVDVQVTTRGEAAPHSGFGIKGITDETRVFVAKFEKVELPTKLPSGGRGPDVVGEVVGKYSGRPFVPERAGGPIRELDYSRIRFTEHAVDVVESHLRRFGGGGEMELAMVSRLRRIVSGEIPATDFDRAFYSHELRESVRYRSMGMREGQPLDADAAYRAWNDAHTATLEDYRIAERLPGGGRTLFHPDVIATFEAGPTGARGVSPFGPGERPRLAPAETIEPRIRKSLESELRALGHPPEALRGLSDQKILERFTQAQLEQAPRRIAAYRATLDQRAQVELDSLQAAAHLHHEPIAGHLQARVSAALDTPVHVDPTIPPGEVRVRYKVGLLGNVHGIELHVGAGATLGDVLGHVPTLAAYKRYQGVTGMVRRVTDSVTRLLDGGARMPVGSRAHEAWLEIQKLPGLIEGRRPMVSDLALDATTRLRVEAEITRIERQLIRHVGELGDLSAGRGYVAVEDTHVKSVDAPDAGVKRPFRRDGFPDEVRQAIETNGDQGVVFEAINWQARDARALPEGNYVYIIRDVGEPVVGEGVLKVGKTSNDPTSNPLDRRMAAYRNAADLTGRRVQVELYYVGETVDATNLETLLRQRLYGRAPGVNAEKGFQWDNAVEHNRPRFGPGTPGEPPKHYEDVHVVSETERVTEAGTKEIVVRHEDGFEQTITTRKTECQPGQKFAIPREELYEWRRFPGDEWAIVRRGAAEGTRPEVTLSPTDRLRTLSPAERRTEMEALLKAHKGNLSAVGKALGVVRSGVYPYLKPPFIDPPLNPDDFRGGR